MLQILQKGSIQYNSSTGKIVTINISDNYYSNILRKASEIEVEGEVSFITITKLKS